MSSLDELEKRYVATLESSSVLALNEAVVRYLDFVRETSPFNTICRERRLFERFPSDIKIPEQMLRVRLRHVHAELVSASAELLPASRQLVSVSTKEEKLCLATEHDSRCYIFRKSGGKTSDRWKIIMTLLKSKQPCSTRDIARALSKNADDKSVRENVRVTLGEINTHWKEKTSCAMDIIVNTQPSRTKLFSLNRAVFDFR